MFTEDCMDDDELDAMDNRLDLEECVMEQILKDAGSGLITEILRSLTKLSEDSLLEFLPVNHPAWQGRRHQSDTENALLMPSYVIQPFDSPIASQFLWSQN